MEKTVVDSVTEMAKASFKPVTLKENQRIENCYLKNLSFGKRFSFDSKMWQSRIRKEQYSTTKS